MLTAGGLPDGFPAPRQNLAALSVHAEQTDPTAISSARAMHRRIALTFTHRIAGGPDTLSLAGEGSGNASQTRHSDQPGCGGAGFGLWITGAVEAQARPIDAATRPTHQSLNGGSPQHWNFDIQAP